MVHWIHQEDKMKFVANEENENELGVLLLALKGFVNSNATYALKSIGYRLIDSVEDALQEYEENQTWKDWRAPTRKKN
jgi:hypothetical protein